MRTLYYIIFYDDADDKWQLWGHDCSHEEYLDHNWGGFDDRYDSMAKEFDIYFSKKAAQGLAYLLSTEVEDG